MNLPTELQNKTVLVAGCGGGYDVVCGLPVALQLARQGCRVHLASFSFTNLGLLTGTTTRPGQVTVVGPRSTGTGYCPEVHLSRWLANQEPAISPEIFCYSALAVQPLKEVFDQLASELGIEVLLVVDGGVDGLFRGDEHDLGSPTIDAISMVAGTLCSIPEKHYVMTAFGTEGINKEVSHAQALERISEVVRLGGFHGTCALVPQDPVTQRFDKCIEAMYARTDRIHHSNMVGSLRASYQGKFGDVEVTAKTSIHPVWVSALTGLYWFLDLGTTARLKLYFEPLSKTRDYLEATKLVATYLSVTGDRKGKDAKPLIPI